MTIKVSIDGVILDEDSARISVLDRGFLYGDSVYEVIRTYNGQPFATPEHLHRLSRSAALLDIELPVSVELLASEIRATVDAAQNPESYIRVIVTRGAGDIGLDPSLAIQPCRVIIVTRLTLQADVLYQEGASIHLVRAGRLSGGAVPLAAKSGNYLVNIMALRVALRQGAHEAVLLDAEGRITEGSSSNIFALFGRRLHTPALSVGILEGITRKRVMALAQGMDLEVSEAELRPADLHRADEIFLTSTLREVLPVTQVDDWRVGPVGPVSRDLRLKLQRLALGAGSLKSEVPS